MKPIEWLLWDRTQLENARVSEKHLLLLFTSAWCEDCDVFERALSEDAHTSQTLHERFVAIKVDSDLQPHLAMRYGSTDLPALAIVTPDGLKIAAQSLNDIAAARSFLNTAHLQEARKSDDDAESSSDPAEDLIFLQDTLSSIDDHFDSRHGGFGLGVKRPDPDSLLLLLASDAWGYPKTRNQSIKTLRSMTRSALKDIIEGGFFAISKKRDWNSPYHGKTLELNARLLLCYLAGHVASGIREFATTARETAAFLLEILLQPDRSLFANCQIANPGYFEADAPGRRAMRAPGVEAVFGSSQNALAAKALYRCWRVFGDPTYLDVAHDVTERLLHTALGSTGEVVHLIDSGGVGSPVGWLKDQALLAALMIESYQAEGDQSRLVALERIIAFCEHELADESGAFYDLSPHRAQQLGLQPLVPARHNALIAKALANAWAVTGRTRYLKRARNVMKSALPTRDPDIYDAAIALALGITVRPIAVLTGSHTNDIAKIAGARFYAGVSLRYVPALESSARILSASGQVQAVDPGRLEKTLQPLLRLTGAQLAGGPPEMSRRSRLSN